MRVLGIIPARFASTRFPGKPLVDIKGKTMIQRVFEQSCKSDLLTKIVVATDDERILNETARFGGQAVMTSASHRSGTERCNEVAEKFFLTGEYYDAVVNIQGDEPFIDPRQIDMVVGLLQNESVLLATLVKKINTLDELLSPNVVKVVRDNRNRAIYFSRSPVPYLRGAEQHEWLRQHNFYKHIGLYGYRYTTLKEIVNLPSGRLEEAESLEQLRWIENGYTIHVAETSLESIAIDTPDDLAKIFDR